MHRGARGLLPPELHVGRRGARRAGLHHPDHDRERFEQRKRYMLQAVELLNAEYGYELATIEITDSYYNMKEMILPHMELIDLARESMEELDIEPLIIAVRGGTDGRVCPTWGFPVRTSAPGASTRTVRTSTCRFRRCVASPTCWCFWCRSSPQPRARTRGNDRFSIGGRRRCEGRRLAV